MIPRKTPIQARHQGTKRQRKLKAKIKMNQAKKIKQEELQKRKVKKTKRKKQKKSKELSRETLLEMQWKEYVYLHKSYDNIHDIIPLVQKKLGFWQSSLPILWQNKCYALLYISRGPLFCPIKDENADWYGHQQLVVQQIMTKPSLFRTGVATAFLTELQQACKALSPPLCVQVQCVVSPEGKKLMQKLAWPVYPADNSSYVFCNGDKEME